MSIPSIDRLDLAHRQILVRVDFNVPLGPECEVTDATRIRAALPTVRHAIAHGAKLILASHLGRPKGVVEPALSLEPAARALQSLLGRPVALASGCVGPAVRHQVAALSDGDVLMLENLRFHAEEEANDPGFSRALAGLADVYVNDAFGSSHRAHASVVGAVEHFRGPPGRRGVGLLMRKELDALSALLEAPRKPFVAILGGAKVSDKIGLIRNLLPRADDIVIGGGMAYTLLQARGVGIGKSLVEPDSIEEAKRVLADARSRGVGVHLPQDHVVAEALAAGAASETTAGADVPDDRLGVDVGPRTVASFRKVLQSAKTVFWNGPMGVFEMAPYDRGTREVAQMVASLTDCFSVAGGGDTVAALTQADLAGRIGHISTGGGAALEFLESGDLPGLAALRG